MQQFAGCSRCDDGGGVPSFLRRKTKVGGPWPIRCSAEAAQVVRASPSDPAREPTSRRAPGNQPVLQHVLILNSQAAASIGTASSVASTCPGPNTTRRLWSRSALDLQRCWRPLGRLFLYRQRLSHQLCAAHEVPAPPQRRFLLVALPAHLSAMVGHAHCLIYPRAPVGRDAQPA